MNCRTGAGGWGQLDGIPCWRYRYSSYRHPWLMRRRCEQAAPACEMDERSRVHLGGFIPPTWKPLWRQCS